MSHTHTFGSIHNEQLTFFRLCFFVFLRSPSFVTSVIKGSLTDNSFSCLFLQQGCQAISTRYSSGIYLLKNTLQQLISGCRVKHKIISPKNNQLIQTKCMVSNYKLSYLQISFFPPTSFKQQPQANKHIMFMFKQD